jgi:hypothetical protein
MSPFSSVFRPYLVEDFWRELFELGPAARMGRGSVVTRSDFPQEDMRKTLTRISSTLDDCHLAFG